MLMADIELLTVGEAAKAVKMHPDTIRRFIREGKLEASRVGGRWRVHMDTLRRFVGSSEPTKPPASEKAGD
jgi:excisionase family DNA binding protein